MSKGNSNSLKFAITVIFYFACKIDIAVLYGCTSYTRIVPFKRTLLSCSVCLNNLNYPFNMINLSYILFQT